MLPPPSKGHPWLPQPPPRSAPRFSLRLCFSVMFVLPTYGPGWKSNRAGGQMNLRGGDKAIITGNVSNPRPAQHWFSREKVYSACGAKLGKEWKRLRSPPSARLRSCQHFPPSHPQQDMHAQTHTLVLSKCWNKPVKEPRASIGDDASKKYNHRKTYWMKQAAAIYSGWT